MSPMPSLKTAVTFNTDGQSLSRAQLLFVAELAGEAERYNDVIANLKKIIRQHGPVLSLDERNLLSVAYKNLTNNLRNSWRTVDTLEKLQAARYTRSGSHSSSQERTQSHDKDKTQRRGTHQEKTQEKTHQEKTQHQEKSQTQTPSSRQITLVRKQRDKIEGELAAVCKDIVELLDKKLIGAAKTGEARVFYVKMKGDYYRYLAEFALKRERSDYADKSLQAYKIAYMHALSVLDPDHPTRLGLALNFSVYYHDVLQSPDRASHLAKSAFDDAVSTFRQDESGACIVTSTTRDSLMILQLLRDDLVLWAAEMLEADKPR